MNSFNRMTVCLFLSTISGPLSAVEYSIVDIGSLGGARTVAYDLNNNGEVVGYSQNTNGESLPFIYSAGVMSSLTKLSENGFSNAYSINNFGQVVGYGQDDGGIWRSIEYVNGQAQQINISTSVNDRARAIDDFGRIFGYFEDAQGTVLPYVAGDNGFSILSFNGLENLSLKNASDNGRVVVELRRDRLIVAIMQYHAGAYSTVYEPLSLAYGSAQAINNAGTVVGTAFNPATSYTQAAVFANGEVEFIGSLLGQNSIANGINSFGTIVGADGFEDIDAGIYFSAGFVYRNGGLFDLNMLIDPSFGYYIDEAIAINDNGQILARGYENGFQRGYILTPITVPEPNALSVVMLVTAATLFRMMFGRSHAVRLPLEVFVTLADDGD